MSRIWSSLRIPLVVGLVVVGSFAAACSSNSEGESKSSSSNSKSTTTAANSSSSSGGESASIAVEMNEWAIKPAGAAKAGKVEFKIKNAGATPHELYIIKTDVAFDKLEKAAGIVDEKKYPAVARSKQVDGGASGEVSATLTAGKYVLICNISGHYDLGMRTAFTVN